MIPLERSISHHEAQQRLRKLFCSMGINFDLEVVGEDLKTVKCTLTDKAGEYLDFGYGKGDLDSSTTGAMFEAAEHWLSQYSNSDNSLVTNFSTNSFFKNTNLKDIIPLSLLNNHPNSVLPFRLYIRVCGFEESYYPLALSNPKYIDDLIENNQYFDNFNYKELERYSTNSGVAIGSNEVEAVIHGLLEAIERDCFSNFLVNAFLFRNKSYIRLIDNKSLPKEQYSTLLNAKKETGHEICIFEFKNKYNIPVFCSSLKGSSFNIEITGYGCSLSRDHAFHRSIIELVQCYHASTQFHPESVAKRTKFVLSKLKDYNFHLQCAKLKIYEQTKVLSVAQIKYSETEDQDFVMPLDKYLESIVDKIEKCGDRAFYSKLFGGGDEISVCHSFIDGQDSFFLVTEGCLVFPNKLIDNSEESYDKAIKQTSYSCNQ